MKISELIKELEVAKENCGDLECFSRSKKGKFHGFKNINIYNNAKVEQHDCGMNMLSKVYTDTNGTRVVTI